MKDTNNIFPLLNKNKTYILGCSFGPDSMALFHMLYINHYSFVVAFVNYHKRKEADDEQKQLTEYCEQRNIKITKSILTRRGKVIRSNLKKVFADIFAEEVIFVIQK